MDEVRIGDVVLTFDGQVLEVFGYVVAVSMIAPAASTRFHAHNLRIEVRRRIARAGARCGCRCRTGTAPG